LNLPAMEVGTVVGDFETEVAGHGDSKGNRGCSLSATNQKVSLQRKGGTELAANYCLFTRLNLSGYPA
jgi:hypothetical protein